MTDLATRIADARKKHEAGIRLLKRVSAAGKSSSYHEYLMSQHNLFIEMADEIDRLKAQLEKAREALEPFAKAADELIPGTPDNAGVMWDGITAMANAGHLRAAARVHAELAEKEKE